VKRGEVLTFRRNREAAAATPDPAIPTPLIGQTGRPVPDPAIPDGAFSIRPGP
jgi:hypothetical protein